MVGLGKQKQIESDFYGGREVQHEVSVTKETGRCVCIVPPAKATILLKEVKELTHFLVLCAKFLATELFHLPILSFMAISLSRG